MWHHNNCTQAWFQLNNWTKWFRFNGYTGYENIVKLLIENGANVNTENNDKNGALSIALDKGNHSNKL